MNTTTFEQTVDAEIKAVASRWYYMTQVRATIAIRALRAKSKYQAKVYGEEAERYTSDIECLEQTLKFHLSFQDGRRYMISPGFVITMDQNEEIGIEGINKPETFEEAGL